MSRQRVLITGVSSGIGAALAKRLASTFEVWGTYRTRNQIVSDLEIIGVKLIQADLVLEIEKVEAILKSESFDILINNAGKMKLERFRDHDEEAFRSIFEINFWAPIRLMRVMLKLSSAQSPKRVINITSMVQWISSPFLSSYVASKRALEGVAEAMQREDGSKYCQVCSVEPGFIKTQMYSYIEQWMDSRPEEARDLKFLVEKFREMPTVPIDYFCEKVVYLLSREKMPLRFPVGHYSVQQISQKIESWSHEVVEWKQLNPAQL